MSNAFSGLWLVELISQVNTQAKEALVIQSDWVFVNGMTHWISLIAGLEYKMEWWNGEWNGTIGVCIYG